MRLIEVAAFVLIVLWFLGFLLHFAGWLIHILLILAIIFLAVKLFKRPT